MAAPSLLVVGDWFKAGFRLKNEAPHSTSNQQPATRSSVVGCRLSGRDCLDDDSRLNDRAETSASLLVSSRAAAAQRRTVEGSPAETPGALAFFARRLRPGSPTTDNRQPTTAARFSRGFTIAELVTVCAIIAILASIALPVARFGIRRQKEMELRDRLRKITEAIDRYHDLMLMGQMNPQQQQQQQPGQLPMVRPAQMQALGSDGYPKDLEELLKGVKMSDGKTVRLLRERDLIDPMTGRNEWITLSTTDDPDTSMSNGDNVYEVHSTSTALSLDGKTRYNEW
jgi:general secretion pathway protein G